MIPTTLHPMVIHLPLVLALFVPIILTWMWLTKRTIRQNRWIVALQAILFASALLAMQLGERDEDRVESYVAESALENHEDWGTILVWLQGLTLLVASGAALLPKRSILLATVVMSSTGMAAALAAGHSGGELVYRHGAAAAYATIGNTAKNTGAFQEDD